ncbi:hypothetical protein BGZ58_010382 [Dissophora ornata]|nr:hypothetical protein BGZ58_010382 [Dissophora ornata]
MSIRLVSSAKNLREQFRTPSNSTGSNVANPMSSSGASASTSPNGPSLSRQGSLMRSSSSGLLRSKSMQKRSLMAKVFADEVLDPHNALPDLSMEMTLLIVKRCVKEIRERGLTTKGILRQVQMGQSQKVIIDTIRMILDDDATTELSPLRQIDIHLVAHAMKWAIRYSEEILVTYEDYQVLYINQDRNFTRFARDLPPTSRAILLDLFSLCADVTLLAHLNNMTLVAVAKAISLSIMAGPEREFSTFDASLQQRNMWGAACEDLLRAFLRIKTTYDLAKIDQEDEVDENRYICNETRVLKSARQRSNEIGRIPNNISFPSPMDISVPSSAGSSLPGSTGWSTPVGPMSTTLYNNSTNGYFDMASPRPVSPLSQAGGSYGASLSRSQSLAKPNFPVSAPILLPRPTSPSTYNVEDIAEYEELMQDRSHLHKLRQERNIFMRPAQSIRRRSSVADMDSLYMLSMEAETPTDGYESDPEVSHAHDDDYSPEESLIPDFADGLGWDFNKEVDMTSSDMPSLASFQSQQASGNKHGVNRSNSASSNASGFGPNGPSYMASPRSIRDLSKQQLTSMRLRQLQEQHQAESANRAPLQQDTSTGDQIPSPSRTRFSHAVKTSPSFSPQRTRRNSAMRRSISLDPVTMHGRIHKRPDELHADLLARELALKTEKDLVAKDIHTQLLEVKNADHQEPARASSEFSLQLSPQDLERLDVVSRQSSLLSMIARPQSMLDHNFNNVLHSASAKSSMSAFRPSQQQQQQQQISAPAKEPEAPRTFEVVSRPKDIEVSVIFAPIPTTGPVSPKTDLRSKFQESFPDRPISPPGGYNHSSGGPKRSLTMNSTKSAQNVKLSTSPPLRSTLVQHSATFSGASTSSQLSVSDGRPKTPNFIRALSSRLRSKQSEDQLRSVKSNNQAGASPEAPVVSIEPPRLELNFMDGGLSPSELSPRAGDEDRLPPTSAPAMMLQQGAGTNILESWRLQAQATLPTPTEGTTSNNGETGSTKQDLRPAGFAAMRRASAIALGSGNVTDREQRRKFKKGKSLIASALKSKSNSAVKKNGTVSSAPNLTAPSTATRLILNGKGILPDSSYSSTGDSGKAAESTGIPFPVQQQVQQEPMQTSTSEEVNGVSPGELSESNILKKTAAVEKDFHFSTATLLKDGKLLYKLQWDQFSELGFKSDFIAKPEQRLSGVHQHGLGKASLAANSGSHSLDPLGQLGQATRTQDQGPSQPQRAAAIKVAQESFMALANDPKALEALRAGSASGVAQPTIISSGSFVKGSAQPQLDILPRPPVITSKLGLRQQPYPSPDPSPSGSLKSARSLEMVSADGERRGNAQKNMSGKYSPTSPVVEAAPLSDSRTAMLLGSAAVGGGGHSSSAPSSSGPRLDKRSDLALVKTKGGSRLFGRKKKNNFGRLSGSTTSLASALPSSSNNGRKRRLLPNGVKRQDVMTRTVESMDEVFPWMCIEHMAGQDSGWVMLEPVQDGAVGWVIIDKLENEMAHLVGPQQQQPEQQLEQQLEQQPEQQKPFDSTRTAMQAQVA